MRTSQKTAGIITTIGIDLGKTTFHLIGGTFRKCRSGSSMSEIGVKSDVAKRCRHVAD
jgi:hypothetical protein